MCTPFIDVSKWHAIAVLPTYGQIDNKERNILWMVTRSISKDLAAEQTEGNRSSWNVFRTRLTVASSVLGLLLRFLLRTDPSSKIFVRHLRTAVVCGIRAGIFVELRWSTAYHWTNSTPNYLVDRSHFIEFCIYLQMGLLTFLRNQSSKPRRISDAQLVVNVP